MNESKNMINNVDLKMLFCETNQWLQLLITFNEKSKTSKRLFSNSTVNFNQLWQLLCKSYTVSIILAAGGAIIMST